MRADIHPEYSTLNVRCSCGNEFETGSTIVDGSLHVEVCNMCHPFYTGKQKMLDSGGRVKKFQDRFGASGASKPETKKTEAKVEETAVEDVLETPVEEVLEETVAEEVEAEEVVEEISEENAEAETDAESESEEEK